MCYLFTASFLKEIKESTLLESEVRDRFLSPTKPSYNSNLMTCFVARTFV